MNQNMHFYIAIISKENNISNISLTINNLKKNNCNDNEYIIVINKEDQDVKKFCDESNLKYYEYENISEVYYNLPKMIQADYISFINAGDTYSEGFKDKLINQLNSKKDNLFIFPILFDTSKYSLNKTILKEKEINIEKKPEKIWIHLNSTFISKKILDKINEQTNDNLKYYIEENLLTKIISLNGGYTPIHNIKLISIRHLEDSPEAKKESYDIIWYKNIFNNIKDIFEFSKKRYGIILQYIQYSSIYLIKNLINENVNSKNKHILVDEKLNEFYKATKEILQNIDDEVIMKTQGNKLTNFYLLRLKYGYLERDIEYREFENKVHVINNDKMIFNASDTKIKILLMDYIDKNLIITAMYPFPFDEKKLKIYAKYLDNKIYADKNYVYSDYKAFGMKLYENYCFDIKIPLKTDKQKQYIEFFLESDKSTVKLDINFNKPLSRLSNLKYSYWTCGNFTLNYRQQSILIMENSKLRHTKREIKYICSLLHSKKVEARKSGALRILYNITKPLFRKEIWLFEDKIYKGGDNGEYLYTYASKQKDGIKKYYILKKNCIDAKRFKKEHKKYVKFGSLRHKLLFLNSNIVFQTHTNVIKQHSFDEKSEKYFRDLYNSDNMCIQHGLTVQYIPHLTSRISDNLKQFFLASPIEKKNMENKEYAYEGHLNCLKITGSPRYDGLKNNDKKIILITPTWRSYLALPSPGYGQSRIYNDEFKKSDYFKIYNNLINNKKLINVAKENGYKIIYLLHPCTSSQINDYDKNENVELIAATDNMNYEDILTKSSLMITDYSGVQFDFAYMYKPIIYFHPDELPPSHDEGEYKYETMALGEIVKTNDELVEALCGYMKNKCKIKDKYRERVDKFFKYHDYNNCKRIYDTIMNFRNTEGENNEFIK